MLNPSTADAVVDDPTIKRCINFAASWGYGSLEVVNLFALRSPEPALLLKVPDPIGPENNDYIIKSVSKSGIIIAAWGTHGRILNRDEEVLTMIKRDLHCLGKSKQGCPKHPLYIKSDILPIAY